MKRGKLFNTFVVIEQGVSQCEASASVCGETMRKNVNIEHERLLSLIDKLSKTNRPFWKRIAELLAKPRRQRVEVNLNKIEKYAKDGTTVIVPGKVLGKGQLTKPVIVAAFAFSAAAKKEIENAGGKCISIEQAHKELKELKDSLLLI